MKFVAITSCPTGIAHTYMAAEALEVAGKAAGHDVQVETQGSAGSAPFDPAVIAAADGVIFAADLEVRDKDRFAGLPFVDVGVKKAVSDAPGVVAAAVPPVEAAPKGSAAAAAAPALATKVTSNARVGTRVRQWLMTGVSYMIPFVAAGGIMIALSFLIGGYKINTVTATDLIASFDPLSKHDWAGLLFVLGGSAFGFLVPVLAGFIAFGIADRPGIAPGFAAGAVAVYVGAGFIGGLVGGVLAGLVAYWISQITVPRWLRGLMPVVIIPLFATLVAGGLMLLVLGRPLADATKGLTDWLNGLSGSSAVLLGIILGLMMAFDLGGPVNKAAYAFATAGLSAATPASYHVMAAVMAAGMVPPLALALATAIRPSLFSAAERENGKAAWLLGASFISEGAIPFAAADPLRVIPSGMIGAATTGALIMATDVELRAPHGGIFVLFAISPWYWFIISLVVGTVISAVANVVAKQFIRRRPAPGTPEAEASADPELATAGARQPVAA